MLVSQRAGFNTNIKKINKNSNFFIDAI